MWQEMAPYIKILKKTYFLLLPSTAKIGTILEIFSLKDDFVKNNQFFGQIEDNRNWPAHPNDHFDMWWPSVRFSKRFIKSPYLKTNKLYLQEFPCFRHYFHHYTRFLASRAYFYCIFRKHMIIIIDENVAFKKLSFEDNYQKKTKMSF